MSYNLYNQEKKLVLESAKESIAEKKLDPDVGIKYKMGKNTVKRVMQTRSKAKKQQNNKLD